MSTWIQGAVVSHGKLLPKDDVVSWLEKQTTGYEYLLAHDDDGVIWGKVQTSQNKTNIILAKDAIPASNENDVVRIPLDARTLQQARLFGQAEELRLWRIGKSWHYAKIRNNPQTIGNALQREEEYLLWGTGGRPLQQGFIVLVDGKEGLRHAPPIDQPVSDTECVALIVRHYAEMERETNFVRQQTSRLVGFKIKSLPKELRP